MQVDPDTGLSRARPQEGHRIAVVSIIGPVGKDGPAATAGVAVLRAVQEVRPALILSTLAIIVSFLPLVFITGMMGPYMRPMALNVPLAMISSMTP